MGGGKLNNKAFTLIELLAIIVILAIIAVITVPIILNIIENSRMGAATDSAYGYKDAVNKWYVTKLQEDNQFQLASSYTISSDGKLGDIVIPISGDKPSGGYLNYSNNTLTGGCLVIGDYAVTFEGGNATSTIKGECSSSSNNSGNEQGNSESGSSSAVTYAYSIAEYGYDSNDSTTISEERPVGYPNYLRYTLTNEGNVDTTIKPEVCIYSEAYTLKELCLSIDDVENSSSKIKTYFGFNENTWIKNSNYTWVNSSDNPTITCNYDSGGTYNHGNLDIDCYDSTVDVGVSIGNPDDDYGNYVSTGYLGESFYCYMYSNDYIHCSW